MGGRARTYFGFRIGIRGENWKTHSRPPPTPPRNIIVGARPSYLPAAHEPALPGPRSPPPPRPVLALFVFSLGEIVSSPGPEPSYTPSLILRSSACPHRQAAPTCPPLHRSPTSFRSGPLHPLHRVPAQTNPKTPPPPPSCGRQTGEHRLHLLLAHSSTVPTFFFSHLFGNASGLVCWLPLRCPQLRRRAYPRPSAARAEVLNRLHPSLRPSAEVH